MYTYSMVYYAQYVVCGTFGECYLNYIQYYSNNKLVVIDDSDIHIVINSKLSQVCE